MYTHTYVYEPIIKVERAYGFEEPGRWVGLHGKKKRNDVIII